MTIAGLLLSGSIPRLLALTTIVARRRSAPTQRRHNVPRRHRAVPLRRRLATDRLAEDVLPAAAIAAVRTRTATKPQRLNFTQISSMKGPLATSGPLFLVHIRSRNVRSIKCAEAIYIAHAMDYSIIPCFL